ncbi:MAG: hypothetical protein JWO11_1043 [Nocardioides sp.]|nr:hypothetical protein [Nocardioides sp.]
MLLVAGVLLLQAAWIMAVPPFRASDEFDHAYRAAGVASGQWRLSEPASNGHGELVDVPADLVEAASAQCAALKYTGHDNCFPAAENADGSVRVATGAGSYNPVYYWVVGTLAHPFSGSTALYAMRVASAAMCAVLLGLSGWVLIAIGAGLWTRLGLFVSTTPVVMFSASITAPNGLEICAGLLLWCSGLALVSARSSPSGRARYWALAGVAAGLLGFVRLLGPLWLALIVLTLALFMGRDRLRELWAGDKRRCLAVLLVAFGSVCGGAAWVITANGAPPVGGSEGVVLEWTYLKQPIVWMLQAVAAFPYRDQFAPLAVYPLVLLVVATALVTAIRHGKRNQRLAIVASILFAVLVPTALTLATLKSQGLIWQGRYGMPYIIGVLLLCGVVLDRVGWAPVEGRRLALLAGLMLTTAQVVSIHHVVASELSQSASADDSSWVHPPVLVVDAMVLLGCTLLMLVVLQRRHAR